MIGSIVLHILASLGLVMLGFCVSYTFITIREELKINRK